MATASSFQRQTGYGANAPQPPVVDIGWEPRRKLFISRVFYNGGEHPGKMGQHLGGCSIGYAGKEVTLSNCEVLVADDQHLEWVAVRNANTQFSDAYAPIIGGREPDGKELYIGRFRRDGLWVPGKVGDHLGGISYSFGGSEYHAKDFEILCYHQW
ncbi:hypothetical protein BATDEDRAFT_24543 [Batrachochytrium dendrobatidis JAM81]|uniref:Uncharacterized protein n=1 Tax=Batrachochytrium dendrobatidis (strain JAM81 / FGSC 10211) TaxID=684364 RepID=F4P1A4_BATDJ|nr:uncharacterized protein BATDEDRAFT_24543 [Batrachochytrium dendrobatidis JAM81]EGF80711.1 hypothetical protein BATDEDRAFT_24543 [Batrachochytrium dendrobatidis JAM81]|eukprot:XP_006678478.1 hypothetical protein BATDEDRAFT_24543 [Batrachochytrium dendrobatidis JAM81]